MSEPNFASLGPTLLARKGGAKPAMRPQHGPIPTGQPANLEDLGWNDMGDEDERPANVVNLTPEPANPETAAQAHEQDLVEKAKLEGARAEKPVVLRQQAEIAEKLDAAPVAARKPRARRSALDRGKRAAFTLRLDNERHLKLRLACTMRNLSAQQLVTEALDELLGEMPELDSLAAQMARK
ncbi:MAG: hypothetical protein KDD90_06100 [Sphingomonadaceae bacterium]|jgi:hypothetical protein|nr:hypothetical protein [Sphingomonadaceae bacterium]